MGQWASSVASCLSGSLYMWAEPHQRTMRFLHGLSLRGYTVHATGEKYPFLGREGAPRRRFPSCVFISYVRSASAWSEEANREGACVGEAALRALQGDPPSRRR